MSRRHGSPNDPTSRIALGFEGIELLHSVLDTFSEREAMVIAMRFGLSDGGPKARDEIGQMYGLSRPRVRQIESLCMAKLRHRSRSKLLGVWDEEALVDIVSTPGAGLSRISTDSSTWCSQCHKVPLITRNEFLRAGGLANTARMLAARRHTGPARASRTRQICPVQIFCLPLRGCYVEKRSRWFDEGASTLRLVLDRQGRGYQLPPTGSYYACPSCLAVYPRAAVAARVLTIEDVPPKVLSGRPMLLTCVECNSSSGTNFDAHAAQKAVADAFVHGTVSDREIPATSYIDGIPQRGTAQATENGISLIGIPRQNDPRVAAAYLKALDSLAEDGSPSPRFSFTIHTRFGEARARLSLIRAAYLAAFAALGWSYILRPVMQSIRDQFKSPEAQILETYIFRDPASSNSTRRLLLVDDPDELRCVAVMLGEYSVFLPGLWHPMTWDEVAAAFCRGREAGDRLNLSLRGKEVPWPKWPTYFLDRPVGT